MKKITSSADLGGGPFTKADLRTIFNNELWYVIDSLLSPYIADSFGVIVSGCVVSANGGGFDMTAGLVYLNGEFMVIPAFTGQSFTKYITPASAVNDTRTFADGTSHVLAVTKGATLSASTPMSGQYITISSLISTDSRRWRSGSVGYKVQCVSQARVDSFLGGSGITFQSGLPISASSDTLGEITITHNLGNTNYTVQVTPMDAPSNSATYLSIFSLGANSFKIGTHDTSGRQSCAIAIFV